MGKKFTIDARTILTLGRDSIKDNTTALVELVKNSYDADADRVDIEIFCNSRGKYIRIADNGTGMTEHDVDVNWLRIGFSEKRKSRFSGLKRRKTGEKGIGRISADRLGAILELRTKAVEQDIYGLDVNWDDFNVEGKDLTQITINEVIKPKITIPKSKFKKVTGCGTELIIKQLRQHWTGDDLASLHNELANLTPPFRKVTDFEIHLSSDIDKKFNGRIQSSFNAAAEITLTIEFNGKDTITYAIKDKYLKKEKIAGNIEWKQLIQRNNIEGTSAKENPSFGPVQLVLMFYPRQADTLEGTHLSLSDLREFLDKNAGIKIYRDSIRVKPYGNPEDPEGDWLGLAERKTREPAAISRPTWKVTANQIVGAVYVSRDNNPNLIDSSSREGLIEGEAFNELKQFVLGSLILLESHRHKRFVSQEPSAQIQTSIVENVKFINKELTNLHKGISAIRDQVPTTSQKPLERTLDQVEAVSEKIRGTQKSLNELVSQGRVLRGLATIGISSAVFGHETETSISNFVTATYAANSLLKHAPPKVDRVLFELDKSIKYANQVSAWGAFALARVQRDKRRKRNINVTNLIGKVIDEIQSVYSAIDIEVTKKLQAVDGRTFEMDIETILLNLMTNAYTACQQVNRPRKIRVELKAKEIKKQKGFELIVADSGPGINKNHIERIWEPLFTTKLDRDGKQVGTGLGLTIVQSVVDDLKGLKKVEANASLKGAHFTIWLPLD